MTRDEILINAVKSAQGSNYSGFLNIAPRVGKTKIAIECLRAGGFDKVLVTVPTNDLKDTWEMEMQKWSYYNSNLKVICKASLKKEVDNLYDLILIDECHDLSVSQMGFLALHNCKKLGLSGTVGPKSKFDLKDYLNLREIYLFSIDDAVDSNIISDYRIYLHYVNLDSNQKVMVGTSKKQWMSNEVAQYK